MINQRHPAVADIIVGALGSDAESDSIRCLVDCSRKLEEMGFEVPDWTDMAKGKVPGDEGEDDLCQPKIGWQKQAANSVEESFLNSTAWPSLEDSERALALSQRGPLASVPFVCFPTDRTRRFDSQPFLLLLLRRLGLPLPLSLRSCRCGRPLDALDHHRAACANAGVLGRRGWALESAAARVCREAGARVRTNIFARDVDLAMRNTMDGRRLGVLADGLPLHGGAQLAIDTTMVSLLLRNGVALRGAASTPGVALKAARRRKELTYPEPAGHGGRARLVVLAAEVGGRWSAETAQFLSELASAKVRDLPEALQGDAARAWHKRWSSILSCAAAKSFALSLQDRAPTGVDGHTPSVHEVIRDDRFS